MYLFSWEYCFLISILQQANFSVNIKANEKVLYNFHESL